MTDYAGLKEEIAKPEYDGMSDADIATALTTQAAVTVDANALTARDILMRSATYDWSRVVARSQLPLSNDPNPDLILSAINFTQAFQTGQTVLRTSNPEDFAKLQTDLAALQTAGDVSEESAAAVVALTRGTISRAQQLGFDPMIHDMEQEIAAARIWTP